MTCPFAKVASLLGTPFPLLPPEDHKSFHSPLPSSSSPLTLSDALRLGTATSHRAVEKSRGVTLLLNPALSPVSFDRVDYVRFNIMLLCVYVALEGAMVRAKSDGVVGSLWNESGLIEGLVRSAVIAQDVRAHLEVVREHSGSTLSDLADAAREDRETSTSAAAVQEDVEDPAAREELLRLVESASPDAACLSTQLGPAIEITSDHIALLTPAQTNSTLTYVSSLLSCPPSLLLSHAYTRYLGDLSGGQHIVRKVSKRFPCPDGGFEFYHFDNPAELKTRFRKCIESVNVSNKAMVEGLVREANVAFELNTAVFESLLPAEYRMKDEDLISAVVEKVDLQGDRARWERLALTLVLAGTAAYVTFSLGSSASRIVFA